MTLDTFTRTLGFSHTAREVRDNRLALPVPTGARILGLPRQLPHLYSEEWLAPRCSSPPSFLSPSQTQGLQKGQDLLWTQSTDRSNSREEKN